MGIHVADICLDRTRHNTKHIDGKDSEDLKLLGSELNHLIASKVS